MRMGRAAIWVAELPGTACPADEFGSRVPPARLLVEGAPRDTPQAADHGPVQARCGTGELATWRLVHERHELVRETRHCASDADATDIRATADAVDPSALWYVALHDRTPTAQFDNAFRRPVLGGEITLFVVAGPVAAFVHGGAEQPLGA